MFGGVECKAASQYAWARAGLIDRTPDDRALRAVALGAVCGLAEERHERALRVEGAWVDREPTEAARRGPPRPFLANTTERREGAWEFDMDGVTDWADRNEVTEAAGPDRTERERLLGIDATQKENIVESVHALFICPQVNS